MSHMVLWLVVAAVMALIEAFSFGLITMWFVVGALVAFVADLLGANFVVQVRNRGHSAEPTLVGERGVVCETIDNDGLTGRVELSDHMTWSARSATGEVLPAGMRVEVVAQESIKLIVKPCEPEA